MRTSPVLLSLGLLTLLSACGATVRTAPDTLPEVLSLGRDEHGWVRDTRGHYVRVDGGDVRAHLVSGSELAIAHGATATIPMGLAATAAGSLVVDGPAGSSAHIRARMRGR